MINNKIYMTISKTIDAIGLVYGLANLQEILGVLVLIISLINIVTSYVFKIIDKIKAGDYKGANDELGKAVDEIEDKINKSDQK